MLRLEDLEVYKVALEIGDLVWMIVDKWSFFEKDTLEKQFTRAADSIAFNISEGYGRFHFAEIKISAITAEVRHLKQKQQS